MRNYTLKFRPHLRHIFHAPSLPLPPLIFSYVQALIHGFLWWWACSWLIFSLKWHLQSPFLLLHSTAIDLQEAKDSIDEEDPRPTSSTWNYINLAFSISQPRTKVKECLLSSFLNIEVLNWAILMLHEVVRPRKVFNLSILLFEF